MAIDSLSAANAYRNQIKMMQAAGSDDSAEAAVASNGSSFMKMVESALEGAADAQYKSEALQTQSLTTGKVELSDLVTAVTNAELTLNTVVAVRDRVINAYNDIIKMPI